MSEIRIKENESLDSALRRFKRQCAKAGVLSEIRKNTEVLLFSIQFSAPQAGKFFLFSDTTRAAKAPA